MNFTVDLGADESVRITDQQIEARPPETLAFAVEGTATVTEGMLTGVAGASLRPSRIEVTVDDSRTREIDLENGASLHLETADVGIATPGARDLSPAAFDPSEGDVDARPDAVAFTVEGVVRGVSTATLEAISGRAVALESVTFTVDDPVRSDGGAGDAVLEIALFGYGIVVREDGTIVVGAGGASIGPGVR